MDTLGVVSKRSAMGKFFKVLLGGKNFMVLKNVILNKFTLLVTVTDYYFYF
jgi:hypothetical protein